MAEPPDIDVRDPAGMAEAARRLAAVCPAIERAHARVGTPLWRVREGGYVGLARVIAFQQISTKAAAAIWTRVEARLGDVSPGRMLETPIEDLRACGLSGPKIAHLRSIATAIETGALDFMRLADADDDAARAELVAVKGIGPWTADVYLMFCLGRRDVFPHADIGLSESYRLLMDDEVRQTPKEFLATAEKWRPLRGVAAHLLWAYINAVREGPVGGA